jgi:hypothetical protein
MKLADDAEGWFRFQPWGLQEKREYTGMKTSQRAAPEMNVRRMRKIIRSKKTAGTGLYEYRWLAQQ